MRPYFPFKITGFYMNKSIIIISCILITGCANRPNQSFDSIPMGPRITSHKNPAITADDLQLASKECQYEAHKNTVNMTRHRPTPERPFIPTNNLSFNLDQIDARKNDQLMDSIYANDIQLERYQLESECMEAKGFFSFQPELDKDLAAVKKYCPDSYNAATLCFISNYKR